MANPPPIASPTPSAVWYHMGDLYWNPTDLNSTSGYGTHLGATAENVLVMPNMHDIELDGEELGMEIEDQLHLGMDIHVYAILAEHTVQNYALGFAPHNLSNKAGWEYNTQTHVGKLRSGLSQGILLFVPFDRTNHNAFIMWAAQPKIDSSARIQHALIDTPNLMPVVFRGKAAASGKVFTSDKLANLSI